MKNKIDLRCRQLAGSYQLINNSPGASSPWSNNILGFLDYLENFVIRHEGSLIKLNLNGIYEGDKKVIRERMKKYGNLEEEGIGTKSAMRSMSGKGWATDGEGLSRDSLCMR